MPNGDLEGDSIEGAKFGGFAAEITPLRKVFNHLSVLDLSHKDEGFNRI